MQNPRQIENFIPQPLQCKFKIHTVTGAFLGDCMPEFICTNSSIYKNNVAILCGAQGRMILSISIHRLLHRGKAEHCTRTWRRSTSLFSPASKHSFSPVVDARPWITWQQLTGLFPYAHLPPDTCPPILIRRHKHTT